MKNNRVETRKTGKAFIASALGICLLLGGSTYALWSANAPMNSEATITAGDLRVSSMSANNWFDVSKSAAPVELVDLSGFYMVPGDKLQLDQDMDLIIVGDNISGKLIVELPNSTESTALLAQAKFTVKLFNPEGEEIASVTPATNSNKIEAAVENLEPTSPTGATYGVQVQVELPAGADNATKLQAAVLEDAIITLEQGGPYEKPYPAANPASQFTFVSNATGYTVSAYSGPGGTVVVPQTAVVGGIEKPVTQIDARAFQSKGITSVTLPKSLKTIGDYAFQLNGLTEIDLPNGITTLGRGAFNSNSLTSVRIPDSITIIPNAVFSQNQLTSVKLPSRLTTIGATAFANNNLTTVDLPDSLTSIGTQAFFRNSISSVVIPEGITHLPDAIFGDQRLTVGDVLDVYFPGENRVAPTFAAMSLDAYAKTLVHYKAAASGFTSPWAGYATVTY